MSQRIQAAAQVVIAVVLVIWTVYAVRLFVAVRDALARLGEALDEGIPPSVWGG